MRPKNQQWESGSQSSQAEVSSESALTTGLRSCGTTMSATVSELRKDREGALEGRVAEGKVARPGPLHFASTPSRAEPVRKTALSARICVHNDIVA